MTNIKSSNKFHFLFALLLCCYTVSAQQYKFDRVITYDLRSGERYQQVRNYFNSGHSAYNMRINPNGPAWLATIADSDNKHYHTYTVTGDTDANGNYKFKFSYLKSRKMRRSNIMSKREYEIVTLEKDSLKTIVEFKVYSNSSRKKPTEHAIMELRPHSENLFPVIKPFFMDSILSLTDFKYPDNVVVDYAEHYMGGQKWMYKFTGLETVNYLIPKPVRIIYK